MAGSGEEGRRTIRPEFNRSIMADLQGTRISSDTGFLLLREIVDPFLGSGIPLEIDKVKACL